MPLSGTIQAQADGIMTDLQAALVSIQASYKATHDGYWQGLCSHVVIPKDGMSAVPNKASHPTDQAETWNDVGIPLPASMEIAVAVSPYNGPQGHGYVIIGLVEIAGALWTKVVNEGPEIYREQDWI